MKIAVSNIAWHSSEEDEILEELKKLNVSSIEVAPTKKWQNPTKATISEINEYRDYYKTKGFDIVAIQSMLYNEPELKIFESVESRQQCLEYLNNFIVLAGKLEVKAMVFGSPKNRQKGTLLLSQADDTAIAFFKQLGETASKNNLNFCIEPNPEQYACDYVTNTIAGIEIVEKVDSPGFGLHLDAAGMYLAGENIYEAIVRAKNLLKHFHMSAPYLEAVTADSGVDYSEIARALREIDYQGYISIEMKPSEEGTNKDRVVSAVKLVQSL